MWSPLKSLCALTLLLSLAGCGFTPVYGKNNGLNSAGAKKLAQVRVEPIIEREGQILRNTLLDKLNPTGTSAPAAYVLQVSFSTELVPIAIQIDRSVSRYTRNLYASMQLVRLSDNKVLLENNIRRTASYNVSKSDFATYAASQDTVQRGMQELAADIALRVADALARE